MSDPTVRTFKEGIKFGIVGGSGVLVNFTILTIALYALDLNEPIALALGIIFSMSSNYLLNRIWTFRSENEMRGEYIQYVFLNFLGIVIQYFVALFLELYFDTIGFLNIDLYLFRLPTIYLASFTGILLGFVSNFIFSKYFVFT